MFGDILKGFYESGEYKNMGEQSQDTVFPALISVAKNFGQFVSKHKTALIAFGVFSVFSRLGSGIGYAAEIVDYTVDTHQFDSQSDQLHEKISGSSLAERFVEKIQEMIVGDLKKISLDSEANRLNLEKSQEIIHQSIEDLDVTGGNMPEVPIDQVMDHNPSEEFGDLAEQIKSAENDDETIFHSTVVDNNKTEGAHSPEAESMENEANQKISELIEKIKDGPQRINVKNYNLFSVQETSDFDEGKTVLNDYSKSLTAISQIESISEEEFKLTKEVQISSIGSSPENAVMQAMEEAASFININVSSESNLSEYSADQESGKTFSKRIEMSTNEDIVVTNIEISDYQYDGEKLYEAKITIN